MSGDAFASKNDVENLKDMLHAMDKRQAVLENDFRNFNTAFQTILVKLEALPEKINTQLNTVIDQKIESHKASCQLEELEEKPKTSKKPYIQIILILASIIAALLGVKFI